ncbi:MAG: hypothetical protein M3436_17845 [Pseudomonadota bacterium]|nr:hypothetical protein [Pseudomonadota bacterium]
MKFRQKSIAFLLLIVFAASYTLRAPREPIYEGKPLSWWFTDGSQDPEAQRLDREALKSLGPDAVAWLAYQASRARCWNPEELAHASPLKRGAVSIERTFMGPGPTKADQIHSEAIIALGELGPDGAPAIPALIKAVRNGDNDDRLLAAESLAQIGAASWPAVADAIRRGERRQRLVLLRKLEHWFADPQVATSSTQYLHLIELLLSTLHDPDDDVRAWSAQQLSACAEAWQRSPHFRGGVQSLAQALARMQKQERIVAIDLLATFERAASGAIPTLTALACDPDEITRAHALGALAVIDPDQSRWPALLYELAASPKKELADFAEGALIRAGR